MHIVFGYTKSYKLKHKSKFKSFTKVVKKTRQTIKLCITKKKKKKVIVKINNFKVITTVNSLKITIILY